MRKLLARILRMQANRYLNKQNAVIVVVSGSVGKTSTTQAIATVLSESFSVQKTVKNYNSDIGVPCSIFDQHIPERLYNPFSWMLVFFRIVMKFLVPKNIEVFVLELGTDKPGELAEFAWLKPDIAVVTAVAAEHMEFFETLDRVAQEELTVSHFSETTFINKHMIDQEYLKYADTTELYNYSREDIKHIGLTEKDLNVIGKHSVDAVSAAINVGKWLGIDTDSLKRGALKITPQQGRMNKLAGVHNSILIDDTYNSSPEAVHAAMEYLYSLDNDHKIALLGNMNELGATSEKAHTEMGELCDPKKLDLVVTLGPDANRYTAQAARERGCEVIETNSPYEAADRIKSSLKEHSVILLKGSQNGVFAEEAVKLLLRNPKDSSQLVRQNSFWQKKKLDNFEDAKR